MSGWKRWATFASCLVVVLVVADRSGFTQNQGSRGQPPLSEPDSATLEKEALAEGMVIQNESIHGREYDPAFRASLKGRLMTMTDDQVAALDPLTPSFLSEAIGIDPQVLGDSGADLIFTPVTPCRVVNFVSINPGVNPSFDIAGFCGIPFGPATVVMMNIIAVGPAGNGDFRIFPFGSAVPLASVINYGFPGSGFNVANGLAVPICNPNLTSCSDDIRVQADAAAATLVIDVYGYFSAARPIWAAVNAAGTIARSSEISSVTKLGGLGTYEVITTRNITGCTWTGIVGDNDFSGSALSGEVNINGRAGTTNGLFVQTYSSGGVLADRPFHVLVTCERRSGV